MWFIFIGMWNIIPAALHVSQKSLLWTHSFFIPRCWEIMENSSFLLIKRLLITWTLISFVSLSQKLKSSSNECFWNMNTIININTRPYFLSYFLIKTDNLTFISSIPLRHKTSDDLLNFSYVWSISLDLPRSLSTY